VKLKLKPDFVGGKALARQPRSFECVFAFLDVLLDRSAPVVEIEHTLIGNRRGRDHKANPRKQLVWMPVYLGHNAAWFAPALGLIGEVGVAPFHLARWPSQSAP